MDLHLLEIFCHVYRERSFSRAAQILGLTQPTISLHVKDFEQSIGTPLFNRLGREIEPTAAGRFLYEHGSPILLLKRQLAEQMAQFLNRVEGELLVGASSIPGEYLLPSVIAAFQQHYPNVRARLRIGDTAGTIRDLKNGDVELGVVGAETADKDLVFSPFAHDSLVLVVPAASPWHGRDRVSLQKLRTLPLVVREVGSGTRSALERALASRRVSLADFHVTAEFGSTTAIKRAVSEANGVSFLPALSIATELAAGVLRVVRVERLAPIRRTYYTVVSRRRGQSPLALAFLRHLQSQPLAPAPRRQRHRPAPKAAGA